MIRLSKRQKPNILVQNEAAWTLVISNHIAAGTTPSDTEKSRYRHPDIKAELLLETSEKCAYCESKLRHITYGDVEHIIPKKLEPLKAFEWENLTLACDICNTNKGTHADIIDPYTDNPDAHLAFAGASVLPLAGSVSGIATENNLKLNRLELLERRAERLRTLNRQVHLLVAITDPQKRSVIKRDIEQNDLAADKEYSAMAKAYVLEEFRRIGV